MSLPEVNIQSAPGELNRLHAEIETSLKRTVEYAIRAGEILTQVKERKEHGQFLAWLKESVSFSQQTASNYMRVFQHRNKLPTVGNLQDAYKIVAQIESSEKQTEQQKALKRAAEYNRTGVKPAGWRRGTDDKIAEEEKARDERIAKQKAEMDAAARQREKEKERRKAERESWATMGDILSSAATEALQQNEKRRAFKERIRVSQSGESDLFIEALMDYLDELENDQRRIEACQNIIKVCRNIAADLQRTPA